MRKLFVPIIVAIAASLAVSATPASAGIVDAAAPLRVKVAPFSGTKVKVGKKLTVIMSCSKQCRLKTRFTLITPGLSDSVKGGTSLAPDSPYITGMLLSGFGKNLLKNNYKRSKFKVEIVANDAETGKITRLTRIFRFTK